MAGKHFLILAIAAILTVAVISVHVFMLSPGFIRIEYVGGKYECKVGITGVDSRGFEVGSLFYYKDGVEHKGYFNAYLRSALDWIKGNTPENAIFLNWWDYGHMIVGYAERESVIKNPSQEALISVKDTGQLKEFNSHEMIVDVAKALTTTNENEALEIMRKYNATYILVTAEDGKGKAYWIFNFAELNFTNYLNQSWQPSNLTFDPNQYNALGKRTVIYRILVGAEIQGLTQVYYDENVRIYKRLS